MNLARLVGRTLAVCLPLALVGLIASPSPAGLPVVGRGLGLSIQHHEGRFKRYSPLSPQVLEVQSRIRRGYAAADPDASSAETIRNALAEYGTRVGETIVPLGYALVWNPETGRFEWVCSSLATFAVSFGDLGTVVVRAEERLVFS